MIRRMLSLYHPVFPKSVVYMLQSTEYSPAGFLSWFWRAPSFSSVMNRRTLDMTKVAKLLYWSLMTAIVVHIAASAALIFFGVSDANSLLIVAGATMLVLYPVIWAHLLVVPVIVGRALIVKPKEKRLIAESKHIFGNHAGTIIAVAGSYGKTSMKELLATVLSEGKKVVMTPGNKNVAVSHAAFSKRLSGDEDVIILEYGEGEPGDVRRFAETTQPAIGIITGIAPAHLDKYPTVDAAARDIFELAEYLQHQGVYVNGESAAAKPFTKKSHVTYGTQGLAEWKVSNVQIDYGGTQFTLSNGRQELRLKSTLLGKHQIGPLTLAAVLGLQLGLTEAQVTQGIARTIPYEHRMKPRYLHGAWIIDDTYNGNIEGVKAGLELLKRLDAERKIYVTPGLVDQGVETEAVHIQMGKLIAGANPDLVVLMKNSATEHINSGMKSAGYQGEVRIETDPLDYYTNLDLTVANGDLVLMQNDWTDNYA